MISQAESLTESHHEVGVGVELLLEEGFAAHDWLYSVATLETCFDPVAHFWL